MELFRMDPIDIGDINQKIIDNEKEILFKYGRADALGVGKQIIWDGAQAGANYKGWFESGSDIEIVSSSLDDVLGSGGAVSVDFTGQTAEGEEIRFEDIPLNGTTPVTLQAALTALGRASEYKPLIIIYSAEVRLSEDNSEITGPNHGDISFYAAGSDFATTGMARIKATFGRTLMAIWRCPANMYGYISLVQASGTAGKPSIVSLYTRLWIWGTTPIKTAWVNRGSADIENTPVTIDTGKQLVFPGLDIIIVATPTQASTDVSANFIVQKAEVSGVEFTL